MARRARRARRALEVTRVARRGRLLRVLREIGVTRRERPATREGARAFRLALEELGTTYVKLGQLLSSRPDLLPDVYIDVLSGLVDDVPPVSFAEVREVIEAEIGLDAFARLDEQPLASASIGQIHGALARSGREVVVKVRRPGIAEEVALDLDLLRSLTTMAEDRSETARLLQLAPLADELEAHLTAELDFVEEAHASEVIARLVSEFEHLRVPAVVHPYVTERVLVQERIDGVKVTEEHGVDADRAPGARTRALPRLRPADHGARHLPRRSASRQRAADRRRPAGAARLRPARAARRRHAPDARAAPPRARPQPRRRRRRPHPGPLADAPVVRRGRLRARAPAEAAALPPPAALRRARRRGARRPAADRASARHRAADELRSGRQDAVAGGFGRTGARPNAGPDRAARGGRDRGDAAGGGTPARAGPAALAGLHATRAARAHAAAAEPARLPGRVGHAQVRHRAARARPAGGRRPLARESARGAIIIAALLVASALMARVNDAVALVGFALSVALGLFELWKIFRTPGDL